MRRTGTEYRSATRPRHLSTDATGAALPPAALRLAGLRLAGLHRADRRRAGHAVGSIRHLNHRETLAAYSALIHLSSSLSYPGEPRNHP